MLKALALCLFSVAALSVTAKADTIPVNTTINNTSVVGNLTYNYAGGIFSFAGSSVVVGGTDTYSFISSSLSGSTYGLIFMDAKKQEYQVNLLYKSGVFSLVSINPIPTPNATAVTPEPSSLVLLGTGVLGLAGMARRKYFV